MFKKYFHVERLGSAEVEGILNGTCYIQAKLDGTNASIWNDNGVIKCGSRNREISLDKDSASFAYWTYSDDEEANNIKKLLTDYPHLTIYGEWMGLNKFVGHMKDYDERAKGRLWIFDVFNNTTEQFIPDVHWRELLAEYGLDDFAVETLAVLTNPTMEDILEVAKNNKFLLSNASHAGEGVVIKNYDFINIYGRSAVGKMVLDEYKQNNDIKQQNNAGEVEQRIVDLFLTDSEMNKAQAKIALVCGQDFDIKNPKMVGRFITACFHDAILEECPNWTKKFKDPVVDFMKLRRLSVLKSRKHIGL